MNTAPAGRIGGRGLAVGTFVSEFPQPAAMRIIAAAGADFVILDGEHGAVDIIAARPAIGMCRALGLQVILRLPCIEQSIIARALDAGVHGLLAPTVESVEDAFNLVRCALYPPAGRRGAAIAGAHDDYRPGSLAQKARTANESLLLLCMIESPAGAERVDEIAAVPGIGGCWFGYMDYSSFAGLPGEFEHPEVIAAAGRTASACLAQGKAAGVMTMSAGHLAPYLAFGYNAVAWGSDVQILRSGLADGLATARGALGMHPNPGT